MTTETVELGVSDKEMFQNAMAEEPKQEEQPERARDDKGRFVAAAREEAPPEAKPPETPQAQTQEAAPTEQPEAQKDEAANVPSWRLREVREAREAAERKAQEAEQRAWQVEQQFRQLSEQLQKLQQPKQEPVDFFADPDRAINQHLTPIEQKLERFMQDMTLRQSRTAAIAQHGADKVAEMESAIDGLIAKRHPDMASLAAQMRASDDPAGVAMNWYQRHKLVEQTGGDIESFKAKLLEDAMKDPKFQAKVIELARGAPAAQTGTVVQLPPSLSRVPTAGASHSADDNDASDAALFKHAMRR